METAHQTHTQLAHSQQQLLTTTMNNRFFFFLVAVVAFFSTCTLAAHKAEIKDVADAANEISRRFWKQRETLTLRKV